MPGPLHQTLVALFATVPTLLEEVLRSSERTSRLLPPNDVAVEAVPETTVVEPVELRADAVFVAEAAGRRLVVVLEVQLRRDPTKRQAWVNYAAAASRQFQADNVVVVVVTANEGVARWARRQTVPADRRRLRAARRRAARAYPAQPRLGFRRPGRPGPRARHPARSSTRCGHRRLPPAPARP